jgi:hypothetical protein
MYTPYVISRIIQEVCLRGKYKLSTVTEANPRLHSQTKGSLAANREVTLVGLSTWRIDGSPLLLT